MKRNRESKARTRFIAQMKLNKDGQKILDLFVERNSELSYWKLYQDVKGIVGRGYHFSYSDKEWDRLARSEFSYVYYGLELLINVQGTSSCWYP